MSVRLCSLHAQLLSHKTQRVLPVQKDRDGAAGGWILVSGACSYTFVCREKNLKTDVITVYVIHFGGSGSLRLAEREAQTGHHQLAILGFSQVAKRLHHRSGGVELSQPSDDFPRFVKAPHKGIADRKTAIR